MDGVYKYACSKIKFMPNAFTIVMPPFRSYGEVFNAPPIGGWGVSMLKAGKASPGDKRSFDCQF